MQEQKILMGIPVEKVPGMDKEFLPYPGSVQVACEMCGRLVWQGPEQQALKKREQAVPVICALCAINELKASGVTTVDGAMDRVRMLTTKTREEAINAQN